VFLPFAALVEGCSTTICDASGCPPQVSLSGSLVSAKQLGIVDFRFCTGNTCRDGTIDLPAVKTAKQCVYWQFADWFVCLSKTSEPGTFTLSAASNHFGGENDPHDVTVQITVVDRGSGGVLLDETRTAHSTVTRHDECHLCWGAEATL